MKESGNHQLVYAPEMFLAPGGIARVSRHYLQAIAQSTAPAALSVVVLNDAKITPEDLSPFEATRANAHGCNRSKWRCARVLWRLTQKPRTHVTCTHVAIATLLVVLQRLGRNFTYDVVVHGIEVWKPLSGMQYRALREARLILSVSEYTRRELVDRYPDLEAKTQLLPNALDPSFELSAAAEAPDSTKPTILTVSRLAAHDWEKGIDHLIEAMKTVQQSLPGVELRIVGEGVERPRLEAIAAQHNLQKFVHFLGRVNDSELRNQLNQCTLFALPSRKEGFGLVYLEAMAAGKPCIVADAGGAPEVINPESGICVPYGDVPTLAMALIDAVKKPWDTKLIRARAAEFSFPAFVKRWQRLCFQSP